MNNPLVIRAIVKMAGLVLFLQGAVVFLDHLLNYQVLRSIYYFKDTPNLINLAQVKIWVDELWPPTHGWLLLILAGLYIFFRPMRLATRLGRGVPAGICANCGYDLRASRGSCPECGEPIATPRPASPAPPAPPAPPAKP